MSRPPRPAPEPAEAVPGTERAERAPITAWPFLALVRLYQWTLRPFLGGHCRFQPTCSEYGITALRRHGAIRGGWLTLRRVARCHPWGGFGWDPVPPRAGTPAAGEPDEPDEPVTPDEPEAPPAG